MMPLYCKTSDEGTRHIPTASHGRTHFRKTVDMFTSDLTGNQRAFNGQNQNESSRQHRLKFCHKCIQVHTFAGRVTHLASRHTGIMRRYCANERSAFPKSIDAYTKDIGPALQHRRVELDEGWKKLEEGWKELEQRRADIGVRPRTDDEGMLAVNIGGAIASLSVSLLTDEGLFDDGNALGGLFEGIWESKRVPRDAAGRLVLDESGVCVKHIIRTMLNEGCSGSAVAKTGSGRAGRSALSPDDSLHLMHMSYALGTWQAIPTDTKHTILKGSSTILRPPELLRTGAVLRGWGVGGREEGEMYLIYRASRDGFDTKSFRARCSKDFRKTVTLIRVGTDARDSVVGGYSPVPWAEIPENRSVNNREAFIFMLRDGTCAHPNAFTPARWRCSAGRGTLQATPTSGPLFGASDLRANFNEREGCTIKTGQDVFRADSAAFLGLNGNAVLDVEVWALCNEQQHLASNALKLPADDDFSRTTAGDNRMFGEVIANSLAEERVALQHAFKRMEGAEARVTAASQALRTVYGPDLEANKEGFVVELNVRGTMMTTLRSTLQACPESALAARFDEGKWPVQETDCDEEGRRLIDCRPSVFSKVLDALRIRKRESWSLSDAEKEAGGDARGTAKVVTVEKHDRAGFGEFVDMHFPGCQSFITDIVVCDATQAKDEPTVPDPDMFGDGEYEVDYW